VTVQVYVITPNEKNAEFQGSLQVQNLDNASDFGMIPVNLKTSASTDLTSADPFINMVQQWFSLLTNLFERMSSTHSVSYAIMHQLFSHLRY
jgi:hypothetical protein